MRLHRYEASKVLLQNPHLPLLHPLCITMHKNLLLYFVEISKVFGHDRDPLHHVPSGFHRFNHLISVHPKLKLDVAHFKSFLVIFRHAFSSRILTVAIFIMRSFIDFFPVNLQKRPFWIVLLLLLSFISNA